MATGWWMSDLLESGRGALLAGWIFWIVFSICMHELAHGWVAIWQGDDTPRVTGHMTINPLVHMGWLSLAVFVFTGYAWGTMPVNPSRFRSGRRGHLYVSAAGPGMNIAIAVVCLTTLGVLKGLRYGENSTTEVANNLFVFLRVGGWLNLFLAVFNLLPVPPLDGSTIVASLSRRGYELMQHPFVRQAGFIILLLVLFQSGASGVISARMMELAHWWESIVVSFFR